LTLPFKARRNHPLEEDQKAHNCLVSRYRIIIEHALAHMNRFQGWYRYFATTAKGMVAWCGLWPV
jgi:hypothetical protein